jgi:phage baseplate assembly protein W
MMSAATGQRLGTLEHLRQSIGDILRTPIGTRVMRREYGSALFALVDAPMDAVTVVDIIQATAGAIGRWEPRVRLDRVTVDAVEAGKITLALDLRYLPTGERVRLEGLAV